MTFFLITEVKSIHSLTYSWLQAAQDFHEEQDRKNNETLRESYRIRLGGKQYFEMLILECFFTYLLFTPLISRKQNSLISIMLLIDFLSRRPLNSELFLFIYLFFFREIFATRRFAKVYYFLLSIKSKIFFLL